MKPTSFVVDRPASISDNDVTIEYRRIDRPLEGESVEWTRFDDNTVDAIQGVHRLVGVFEFRAVIDINGVKFTSENYHGEAKKKKKDLFPIIATLFPSGEELAFNNLIQSMAYEKWKEIDDWIVSKNLEFAKEAQTYVYLDTSSSPDAPRYIFISEMNNGTIVDWRESTAQPMQGEVDLDGEGQSPLLPPLKDRLNSNGGTASALYLVAHLHTHPRYDYRPIPDNPVESRSVIKSRPGPSTGHNGNDGDTLEIKQLSKKIKIDLVGLVYDFVGEQLRLEGHTLNGEYVTYAGYDYGNDSGKVYAYGATRRRNSK